MNYKKIKLCVIFRSLMKSGFDPEYAAMTSYCLKYGKMISERTLNFLMNNPCDGEIIKFSKSEHEYIDSVFAKVKRQTISRTQ